MTRADYQASYLREDEQPVDHEPPAGWHDEHSRYWWRCICAAADVTGIATHNLRGPNRVKTEPERTQIRTGKRALAVVLADAGYTEAEMTRALDLSGRQIKSLIGHGREDQQAADVAREIKQETGDL